MIDVLYRRTKERLPLKDALQALQAPAVGLFYSPDACRFGRLDALGNVTGPDGTSLPLEGVYEVRAFHEGAELRWWNDPQEGRHRAALLSDVPLDRAGWEPCDLPVIETLVHTYLLWGQANGGDAGLAAGWTRLTTARLGKLDVPATGSKRFVLVAIEYLTEWADGNAGVADERLRNLAPAPKEA